MINKGSVEAGACKQMEGKLIWNYEPVKRGVHSNPPPAYTPHAITNLLYEGWAYLPLTINKLLQHYFFLLRMWLVYLCYIISRKKYVIQTQLQNMLQTKFKDQQIEHEKTKIYTFQNF